MKYVALAITAILFTCSVFAQTDNDTVPPYKKTTHIPEFAILQSDSTWFTNKQLPAHKPLVIIYFSPDCGHCQLTAQEYVKDMDLLKKAELVWVSYHDPKQIKEFADKYELSHFSNVVLGRDPNYKIPVFYRIQSTPFIAVYDKNGKFLKAFDGGTSPATVAKLIKK